VWLTATHMAGVENIEADKESWLFNDRTEWTLRKEIFVQITAQWGISDIDLYLQTDLLHRFPGLFPGRLTQPRVLGCFSIFLSNS